MQKARAVRQLKQSAACLQTLLRSRQPLSDGELLMIENRLMILRFEYSRWHRDIFSLN
jgi:hypothetical protein